MATYTDQTGNSIMLAGAPRRIVSLVPSQTELLFHLGLEDAVVGITKFCVHPQTWFRNKTRIGGPKQVHIETVKALAPDLIIANKEENLQKEVMELAAFCPVWTSDISDLQQALEMIATVGAMTGTTAKASAITSKIQQAFAALSSCSPCIRSTYLIWQQPYMTVGSDTFIHDMLSRCGFENMYKDQQRYPVTTIEDIRQAGCQLLLLSSEPFPFQQSQLETLQLELPDTSILLVDGEMFSWYGSRLLLAPAYFRSVIHEVNTHVQ
jgi:ABC-type Fe3+-hydroxamate transport system substrate-binding protein